MQKLIILNSKEIKLIKEQLLEHFGVFFQEEYAFLENEKNKLFMINRDLSKIDLAKLRIDKLGLYVAERKEGVLRLSREGAQRLVLEARKKKLPVKNIVNLEETEVKDYFLGQDLEKDLGGENKFVLLAYKKDILGCARYKEGKILNFLPKIYRGEVII